MKITDPVDGKCPACNFTLHHVPSETEMGFTRIPAYDECPACQWRPGEEMNACDMCGKVSNFLTPHEGDVYCIKCKREADLKDAVASIMQAAMAVNFQTKYACFVELVGHCNGIHVRLASGKDKPAYNDVLAKQDIPFEDWANPFETMQKVHRCLCDIAATGKIPTLKMHPWGTQKQPIFEVEERVSV